MNPRAKKIALLGGALAVVCALAAPKLLPLWRARAATAVEGKAGAKEKRGGGSSGATLVGTQKVKPAALAETIELVGTLRADEAVELQAETTGKVTEISFVEGTRVKRGELLVRLNDAELRAGLERAEARRELARLKERRLAALLKNGSVNQQDYDGAASEFAVADADAHVIQAQLEKTVIRAPFDGVVGLRSVSVGAYVATSTRVSTLQALDRLKLDFAVPERHAARLRPGAKLRFTVTGDDAPHAAEVYAVEPRVDEATRTVL
ncbi:MAG TPA: efflux RND transporter periplasmic adaptor subunit, partial [Acidobacteriota bacterium]|nr:efflux RND transporter periplasmic adaptor subunit [Acidobacteriota bacterium]